MKHRRLLSTNPPLHPLIPIFNMSNRTSAHHALQSQDGGQDRRSEGSVDSSRDFQELLYSLETRPLISLWKFIDQYAPHLADSFVRSRGWWDTHGDLPEAHVSSKTDSAPISLMLTLCQMLKYVLSKGMLDILVIFNDAEAKRPETVEALLQKANAKAELVWKDDNVPFSDRVAKCRKILDPLLNADSEVVDFKPVPQEIAGELDGIFEEFYGDPEALLLIGRTHEEAYKVQDEYATAVTNLLGRHSSTYESRAIVCLRKTYGRSSLPILSVRSVEALWRLCQSPFYKRVLSLVSSLFAAHPPPY